MNRLTRKIAAIALAVLVLGAVSAQAKEKQPKHKKNQDLSTNPLANVKSRQPDKELFDKAMTAMKKGRYDVARLDLQTMLNTYPDSEYRMRAKLAVGDTWFKEGGTAAFAQAESEYKDSLKRVSDSEKRMADAQKNSESDPKKVANVIVTLSQRDEVPKRLVLGTAAAAYVEQTELARTEEARKNSDHAFAVNIGDLEMAQFRAADAG